MTTSNRDLSAAARERARHHPGGSLHRRSLLVTAVSLHETNTVEAARNIIANHEPLPDDVRTRALNLLNQLDPAPPTPSERSSPDMPIRHQRPPTNERKGWRKPKGSVLVTRPYTWGNPHPFDEPCPVPACHNAVHTRYEAVDLFEADLLAGTLTTRHGTRWRKPVGLTQARIALAGRDVVCACPLDERCHGDVILKWANPTT